jgi:hypothetical protein
MQSEITHDLKNEFETESVISIATMDSDRVVLLISWFPEAHPYISHGVVFECNVKWAIVLAFDHYRAVAPVIACGDVTSWLFVA